MNTKLAISALPILLLAACSAPESDNGGSTATDGAAPQVSPDQAAPAADSGPEGGWDFSQPADDASLTIAPAAVDFCTDETQSVTASWERVSIN